jgi:hypothetical protein
VAILGIKSSAIDGAKKTIIKKQKFMTVYAYKFVKLEGIS